MRSDDTKARYESATTKFFEFCRVHRLKVASVLAADRAFATYFEHLFETGEAGYAARTALYGFLHVARPEWVGKTKAEHFPLARACLTGWENLEPSKTLDPAPWEAVLLLAQWLRTRDLDAAVAAVVAFDTYCRPSEVLCLTREHIISPARRAGRQYNRWGLVICPQEELQSTKTNKRDDSVLLGIRGREWVADVVAALWKKRSRGQKLFQISLATLERLFRLGVVALGLQGLRLTPHSLRHGGPSTDRYLNNLSLLEIKRRGRWGCDASVERYERHAKLLKQLNRMTPAQQHKGKLAAEILPTLLVEDIGK